MNGGPGKKKNTWTVKSREPKEWFPRSLGRSFKDRVVKIIQTISLVLIPFSPGVLFIIIWLLMYISF